MHCAPPSMCARSSAALLQRCAAHRRERPRHARTRLAFGVHARVGHHPRAGRRHRATTSRKRTLQHLRGSLVPRIRVRRASQGGLGAPRGSRTPTSSSAGRRAACQAWGPLAARICCCTCCVAGSFWRSQFQTKGSSVPPAGSTETLDGAPHTRAQKQQPWRPNKRLGRRRRRRRRRR